MFALRLESRALIRFAHGPTDGEKICSFESKHVEIKKGAERKSYF